MEVTNCCFDGLIRLRVENAVILTGEVKIIGDGVADFLLLPCGATGSSGCDVDAVPILSVLRDAKCSDMNNQC
jgi:hypothetical protein